MGKLKEKLTVIAKNSCGVTKLANNGILRTEGGDGRGEKHD